jgi:PBP1b-binding outer membrane lipoprotein LpoB
MKKIVTLSALSLGILLLAGCGQQQAVQTKPTTPAPVAQQKEQPITTPTTQTAMLTETLNYCGKSFVAEKVEIDGVSIANRILQLAIAKDKNNCINFEQTKNIAVLKIINGNTTSIILYEKASLTDADRQLSTDKQLEKIRSNADYPQVNEYEIKAGSIEQLSAMGGQGTILGKVK